MPARPPAAKPPQIVPDSDSETGEPSSSAPKSAADASAVHATEARAGRRPRPLLPPGTVGQRGVALALLLVAAGALLHHYAEARLPGLVAVGALLVFCLIGQGYFRLRERLLLGVAVVLTVAEFAVEPEALASVRAGLERASFLAAFMLLLGILRDAAATSPAVQATGRFLTQQPPSRRYSAIAGGSHVLTVLLNMGALSLLAPLIQAGTRASRESGDPGWIADIKERRQFSASLRGFAMVIVWAPTTVTQALLAGLFPESDTIRAILYGLGFAALGLGLGWLEDRLRWAQLRRRMAREGRPPAQATPPPLGALRDFACVCAALIGLAMLLRWVFAVETVPALMLAAPVLTVAWIFLQHRGEGAGRAAAVTGGRVREILGRSVPAASPEAITLAAAGYIGTMLAALVPPELVALAASPEVMPPLLLLALLPLLVVLVVQFALTPIVMAVFLGTALGSLDPLPVDANLLVLALSGGWALAMTASPFAAGALILQRMTGLRATDLTWRWNGLYSLLAYLLLLGWLTLLYVAV
jgi:hypothetical protein